MQINSIGDLNSITLGSKEKDCPNCRPKSDEQIVTISGSAYNKLMRLAMIVIVAGGLITISSCGSDSDSEESVEVANQTEVQANTINILNLLGLISTQKSASGDTCFVKKSDMIEMGWHNGYFKNDINLKINEDLCTRTKMVYDGTSTSTEYGDVTYIRRTITSDGDDGINIKKEVTADNKPFTNNSEIVNAGTINLSPNSDWIAEYKIKSDGTEVYQGKYVQNTPTSVIFIPAEGENFYLTNIFVGQK
jgi:hypothetical protein